MSFFCLFHQIIIVKICDGERDRGGESLMINCEPDRLICRLCKPQCNPRFFSEEEPAIILSSHLTLFSRRAIKLAVNKDDYRCWNFPAGQKRRMQPLRFVARRRKTQVYFIAFVVNSHCPHMIFSLRDVTVMRILRQVTLINVRMKF